MSTQAYSDLYYKLASNGEAAAAFFEGILPEDMKAETRKAAPVSTQPGLMVATASAVEALPTETKG